MERLNKAIGQIISKHRKQKGISQEELAKSAMIHRTYVSQIERGLKSPTLYVLYHISIALNVELHNLITEFEQEIKE